MKAATHPGPTTEHPPLAQDSQGNLLPIPDGTFAWRLARHTGGRPRVVNGPDLTPLRLPLHLTVDDLIDICGSGTYRLYALDEVGNVIDYVTEVEIGGGRRNAAPAETDAPVFVPHRAQSSDLRYALEAITHMARTYADSLRAVTEAQADWVKTIAMAKGLPRNVEMFSPPPPEDVADDEEDDEPVANAPRPSSSIEAIGTMLAPYIPELMDGWRNRKGDLRNAGPNPMTHLARIQAQLTPHERKLLDALLDDEDATAITRELTNRSVEDAVAMIRDQAGQPTLTPPVLDSTLMQKVFVVHALLEPAERIRLSKLQLFITRQPALMAELKATLEPMSPQEAVVWIRANIDQLEVRCAS